MYGIYKDFLSLLELLLEAASHSYFSAKQHCSDSLSEAFDSKFEKGSLQALLSGFASFKEIHSLIGICLLVYRFY